ncbi:MAG: hypothetical protein K5857_04090 [Lachnospiraceae bacterium]|nr:hypothetical protein [Lachnospiraceae bacterium]
MTDNRKLRIILAVMAGLILILLCTAFFLMGAAYGRKHAVTAAADTQEETRPRDTVVNRDNIDRISAGGNREKTKRQGPVNYEVIMNTEWVFSEDGRTAANVYVENSRDNKNTVIFTLALEDDPEDILYTSDMLETGKSITGIELDKEVRKGRNRGIVTYRLLDDEGNSVGDVKAGVTLVYSE